MWRWPTNHCGTSMKGNTPVSPDTKPNPDQPASTADQRKGRRYTVGRSTENGKRKVRYVETSDTSKGCKFL